MTLAQVYKGQQIRIISVPEPAAAQQAIRLGLGPGALVRCLAKLPGGPVILTAGFQEVAVGRRLARRILVRGGIF